MFEDEHASDRVVSHRTVRNTQVLYKLCSSANGDFKADKGKKNSPRRARNDELNRQAPVPRETLSHLNRAAHLLCQHYSQNGAVNNAAKLTGQNLSFLNDFRDDGRARNASSLVTRSKT